MAIRHKIGDLVVCKVTTDDIKQDDRNGVIYALGHITYYDANRNKYNVVWHDNDRPSHALSIQMINEMKLLISRMCDGTEKINESGMPKTW